jgi:hypothetical protein
MTLTEFLLARIAEDKNAAREGTTEAQYSGSYGDTAADEVIGMAYNEGVAEAGMKHFERWMPARVLAECEAKRRIIKLLPWLDNASGGIVPALKYSPAQTVLRQMALPYADHPDYREEWRP